MTGSDNKLKRSGFNDALVDTYEALSPSKRKKSSALL